MQSSTHDVRAAAAAFAVGLGVALANGAGVAIADSPDSGSTQAQAPSGGSGSVADSAPSPAKADASSIDRASSLSSVEISAEEAGIDADSVSGGVLGFDDARESEIEEIAAASIESTGVDADRSDGTVETAEDELFFETTPAAVVDVTLDTLLGEEPAGSDSVDESNHESSARPVIAKRVAVLDADDDQLPLAFDTVMESTVGQGDTDGQSTVSDPVGSSAMAAPTIGPATAVAPAPTDSTGPLTTFAHRVMTGISALFGVEHESGESPLATIFSAFFEFARRTFFNTAPSAVPVQYGQLENGKILGSIGATDVDGESIVYRVAEGPTYGSVDIAADGTYTYSLGSAMVGLGGQDTFTVKVRNPGFHINLLNLFAPQTTTVQVTVTVGPIDDAASSSGSSADSTGPLLTGITSTPGSRSINLTFDQPLIFGTAIDLANYSITAPHCGDPEVVTSSGPALKVVATQYSELSTTSSQVTLTLAHPLHRRTFYRIFINGNLPIINGNPNSNPLTGAGGATFDGDNDDTAGGDFYGLFAVGSKLTFADSSGDRVFLAATGGGGLNVWRELNGDIDQITVLPGASALKGWVVPGKASTGTVYIGSVTIPVSTPLVLNGAANNLPQSFVTVPPGGLPTSPPPPTTTSPTPVAATSENLPYTLNITPVSAPGITNLPGIQSGVYAQTAPTHAYPSGLWVVFGGRTNGLHNFSPSGEQSFPPSFQNGVIYVINPVNWQTWSLPWSQTNVAASVYSALSSANQQYYQKGDTLYTVGGYSVPGTVSFTGNVGELSNSVTVTSGLENLAIGQTVSGVLPFPSGQEIFPPGTMITAINANTVTTSHVSEADATGVALAAFTNDFKTFDTLTALSITGMVKAVINGGDVAKLAKVRQMSDPRLAVTGGEMMALNGRTYLVFGNNFQGGYAGSTASIAQVYTNEIRSFRIIDSGRSLAIAGYQALRDPVNFRRRDGNLVRFIGTAGQPQLAYLGGVFTPTSVTAYQAPILIGPGGRAHVDAAYQQFFSQYTTANIPLYDPRSRSMYDILMGGISLYEYSNGQLIEDTFLPWVDDVTSLVRAGDGSFQEYSMSPIPIVTAGGTGFYGANAAFFGNEALPMYRNGVIRLNKLRGPTVLGYMFGGIYSTVPTTSGNSFGETGASNQVFQITLTPT